MKPGFDGCRTGAAMIFIRPASIRPGASIVSMSDAVGLIEGAPSSIGDAVTEERAAVSFLEASSIETILPPSKPTAATSRTNDAPGRLTACRGREKAAAIELDDASIDPSEEPMNNKAAPIETNDEAIENGDEPGDIDDEAIDIDDAPIEEPAEATNPMEKGARAENEPRNTKEEPMKTLSNEVIVAGCLKSVCRQGHDDSPGTTASSRSRSEADAPLGCSPYCASLPRGARSTFCACGT
jgi:hypothetical protein